MTKSERGTAPVLRIVQPWFAAPGHPAQTLLATARALGPNERVRYSIPRLPPDPRLDAVAAAVASIAPLDRYPGPSAHFALATAAALRWLSRDAERVSALLLDGHLATVAALWRVPGFRPASRRLSALYVAGPERILRVPGLLGLVRDFACEPRHRLFLRTDELVEAWRMALGSKAAAHVEALPSLELPGNQVPVPPRASAEGGVRFLVTGQIRPGKGLERLVPLFTRRPELGTLTVAGGFADAAARRRLPDVAGFPGFREGYLRESELLDMVAENDYVMILYDDWDARMEAGNLFLAARVGRPVITYAAGWCGRMVATFGCGLGFQPGGDLAGSLESVPAPGRPAYAALGHGMARFAAAHHPSRLVPEFLRKAIG